MKPIVFDVRDVVCRDGVCQVRIKVDYEYWDLDKKDLLRMRDKLNEAIENMDALGRGRE